MVNKYKRKVANKRFGKRDKDIDITVEKVEQKELDDRLTRKPYTSFLSLTLTWLACPSGSHDLLLPFCYLQTFQII